MSSVAQADHNHWPPPWQQEKDQFQADVDKQGEKLLRLKLKIKETEVSLQR
jgi:hypothetical protein